jgi:hypothetical protein
MVLKQTFNELDLMFYADRFTLKKYFYPKIKVQHNHKMRLNLKADLLTNITIRKWSM